jgi:hypothetical protein
MERQAKAMVDQLPLRMEWIQEATVPRSFFKKSTNNLLTNVTMAV